MFKEAPFGEEEDDEFLRETVIKKKVSPGDEKYLLEQQRVAEDESSNDIFGYALWKFYQASKNIKIEDTEKLFLSRGRETKERLVSLLLSRDKVVRGNANQFIITGFSRSDAACVVMEKHIKEVKDNEDTKEEDRGRILAREFLGLLRREDCPRDVLEIIALLYEGNRSQVEEYQKTLNESQVPAIMAHFKTFHLSLLSMKYSLSREVTERIKAKLESVSFCVVDGLSSEIENLGGYFSPRKNQISIAVPYFDRVQEIINHEVLHAASGRTVIHEAATLEGAEGAFFESYSHTRSGLHYGVGPLLEKDRFVWLNEGITQTLTMEGLASTKRLESMVFNRKAKTPESGVYKSEVELVRLLLTSGKKDIPFKTFVQAYFEDYEPEKEDAIPKWKALQLAITESYGPNFLVSLDKRIQNEGIEAVMESLKSGAFKV